MAHKVLLDETPVKKERKYTMPNINGKFGIALFIGGKEVFVGITTSEVILEQVVRRRFTRTPKAGVKTFRFDPL